MLFPQAKAFTKHSLLWAFNYLTEIYPNPCLLISFKIIEVSEMTRGPTHLHLPPQFQSLTYWPFHRSLDPHPSASFCYPLAHPVAPAAGLLSLPHHIADILFTSFCPHCCIPSIWHPSLCANFCGKGQEFAKEMLAERV